RTSPMPTPQSESAFRTISPSWSSPTRLQSDTGRPSFAMQIAAVAAGPPPRSSQPVARTLMPPDEKLSTVSTRSNTVAPRQSTDTSAMADRLPRFAVDQRPALPAKSEIDDLPRLERDLRLGAHRYRRIAHLEHHHGVGAQRFDYIDCTAQFA